MSFAVWHAPGLIGRMLDAMGEGAAPKLAKLSTPETKKVCRIMPD